MSKLVKSEAIKMSANTKKIVENFTDILSQYNIESHPVDNISGTQLTYNVGNTTYSVDIPHTPYGVRKWAQLLHTLQTTGKLTSRDFQSFYFNFPTEYLKLNDKELVGAVLSDLEYRSFESSHSEAGKKRLHQAIKHVVELGSVASEDKVMVWTEDGRLDFTISDNTEYELGRLSMLAELMEGNYIHDACITSLAEGLKAYQKAVQDSTLTDAFPSMLCCNFKRNAQGEIMADGYVVRDDGSLLPADATFRNGASKNPLNDGVLAWFALEDTDYMLSISKEYDEAPTIIKTIKERTNHGATEEPNAKQQATIWELITDYGITWNPHVDFSAPDAYLNIISNRHVDCPSYAAAYNIIRHYGIRLEEVNRLPAAYGQTFPIDKSEMMTVRYNVGDFHVFIGDNEYTVDINGEKEPLISRFNERDANIFAKLVQAYEIRVLQGITRQYKTIRAAEFNATEMSDNDRAKALQEKAMTEAQVAEQFRSKLKEINRRPGHLMILFNDKVNRGVYLSIEGKYACYFELTEEDYDYFLIAIGEKAPEPSQEEPAPEESTSTDKDSEEPSAEGSQPESNDSEIPGQMALCQRADGNVLPIDRTTGQAKLIMPKFIADAAQNKRDREARKDAE